MKLLTALMELNLCSVTPLNQNLNVFGADDGIVLAGHD